MWPELKNHNWHALAAAAIATTHSQIRTLHFYIVWIEFLGTIFFFECLCVFDIPFEMKFMPTTLSFELSIILRMSFRYLTADCFQKETRMLNWNAMHLCYQHWKLFVTYLNRMSYCVYGFYYSLRNCMSTKIEQNVVVFVVVVAIDEKWLTLKRLALRSYSFISATISN